MKKNLISTLAVLIISLAPLSLMAEAIDLSPEEAEDAIRVFRYSHQEDVYQDENQKCSSYFFDEKLDAFKCINAKQLD